MIGYTAAARRQVSTLREYYKQEQRPEAARSLRTALRDAEARIERDPGAGLPAPRPYPMLAQPGQAWIKAGSYWVRYNTGPAPTITGVFHDQASILGRM